MPEKETSPLKRTIGNSAQRLANGLCYLRATNAIGIGVTHLFAAEPRSPKRAVTTGMNYLTDKLDGELARFASRTLERPPTDDGKRLDQISDKVTHASHGISQSIRAMFVDRHPVYGMTIALNLFLQMRRDAIVNNRRAIAHDIARATGTNIHIGSTPLSKVKLAAAAICDTAGESPLSKHRFGRSIIGLGTIATTVLSIRSGAEMITALHNSCDSALEVAPQTVTSAFDSNREKTPDETFLLSAGKLFGARTTPLPKSI